MQYLNLETWVLHAPEYIGAEPAARATWLNLILWSAEQENDGIILGARLWSDRQWQHTCGVTAAEVEAASSLFALKGDDVHLGFYPHEQQKIALKKRKVARANGRLGGRPSRRKPILKPTLVPTSEPISESVKERKGREGKEKESIAPNGAADGDKLIKPPKQPRERDPLLVALVRIDGSDPAQVTSGGWGATVTALKAIREVCPGLTVEEIDRRVRHYRQHYPNATLTPSALAKHWAKCDHPPQAPQPANQPSREYPAFSK